MRLAAGVLTLPRASNATAAAGTYTAQLLLWAAKGINWKSAAIH
jgi:hypothetical protein